MLALALSSSMGFQKDPVSKITSSMALYWILHEVVRAVPVPAAESELWVKKLLVDSPCKSPFSPVGCLVSF